MKRHILILVINVLTASLFAQKQDSKEYTKMRDDLKEKIFGSEDPLFKNNTVPDAYKNESAVILAQKHSLESDSKFKFRFYVITATGGNKYSFFDIFREKILINDKSALEAYSELNFKKLQAKTQGYLGKLKNYTFVDIRLIKPDGKVKEIDVDESAVTIKDEKNGTQNKIAVPDLAVGDIIDYYICNYYQEEGSGSETPLTFVLGDDYPVLNYEISLQLDAKIAAEYQSINGAPDFKISPDKDGGGNVLSMVVKDVPKIKGLTWSSSYRQLPIVRVNYKRGKISRDGMPDVKEGNVEKVNKSYPDKVESDMAALVNSVSYDMAVMTLAYKNERKEAKDAWKTYIKANPKADSPDSIPSFVFRYFNWKEFFHDRQNNMKTDFNNAYFPVELKYQIYRLVRFAFIVSVEFKTDLEFLVVSGKNSYRREDIFSVGDLSVLVRTPGPRSQYFSFTDNFDFAGMVPYYLGGEKAKVFPFGTRSIMGKKILKVDLKESSVATLPSTQYKDNSSEDILTIRFAQDPELLSITRKVKINGNLKKDAQASLTIFEEMAKQASNSVNEEDGFGPGNTPAAIKDRKELMVLLEKARVKHKEDFEKEIERSYDSKAKELNTYAIKNFGTLPDQPFEFEETFTMEGFVKKAGNNYIVDLGKLISSQVSIEKEQRGRTKDIYMPFPRSFSYRLELEVPADYTVEGLEKFSSSVQNETGAFTSVVKTEGNVITIDVNKYYAHFYEPAAKWPLMLSFLDQALEFNQQKILLRKK